MFSTIQTAQTEINTLLSSKGLSEETVNNLLKATTSAIDVYGTAANAVKKKMPDSF